MCGIAGAIGAIEPEIARAAERASTAQRHRGPDDDGSWRSGADGELGALFLFRRLSILDLSPDGHQPMIDAATGNVIVFNGEIYNYKELREELKKLGESLRSSGDTEVILKAYARWGAAAIERLRGMFALAIWDARAKRVLIARDRVGIKPLYLATATARSGRRVLFFASELRSLLATDLFPRKIHRGALESYLWNGFVVGPESIVEGIQLLPAGTIALVDPATAACEMRRYWTLPHGTNGARTGHVEHLREELRTAVRQHLASDVPLGVFLSGGIDSSAVTALASELAGNDRVKTFNISFDETDLDESRYAIAVAKALGTEHTDVRLTQGHFRDQLDDALRSLDQPTFDAINSYFVSRAVREAGITVALAGTGGDELFGGYKSFADVPRAARAARALRWAPKSLLRAGARAVARAKVGKFGEVPPQTRWGKLGDLLETRGGIVPIYQVTYALFTDDVHRSLLDGRERQRPYGLSASRARDLEQLIRDLPALDAVSLLELSSFIEERLLRDTDCASMAVSLEARVPLLDHVVIEAAAGLDPARRFQPLGRKALLREIALAKLDPAIFDRPKSGFVLPIEKWSRELVKSEVARTLADGALCAQAGIAPAAVARLWCAFEAGAPGMYWSRIWSLYVLLWWCREHRVSV